MTSSGNFAAGHRKRLRDRFIKSSLDGFHDYEVVEIILTYAIPRRDVKPIAKELIRRFKSLKGIFDAECGELSSVNGIGRNAALVVRLFKEAAFAYLEDQGRLNNSHVRSPKDVIDFLDLNHRMESAESFLAIYLNSKNEVLGVETLFEGGLGSSAISARGVIEKAFKHNARAVIFVHRHPDKKASPSDYERNLARELEEAASAVDIIVHDHIIVGKGTHISARESGWLAR